MSYFVFGLAELRPKAVDAQVSDDMRLHARASGFEVALWGEREPALLAEMRGAYLTGAAIPFFIVDGPQGDTSDALVSPHVVGLEGACRGLEAIATWVVQILCTGSVSRMRIWLSEGWDDAFERWDCQPEELAPLLVRRLREGNDIPSMQLNVTTR